MPIALGRGADLQKISICLVSRTHMKEVEVLEAIKKSGALEESCTRLDGEDRTVAVSRGGRWCRNQQPLSLYEIVSRPAASNQ